MGNAKGFTPTLLNGDTPLPMAPGTFAPRVDEEVRALWSRARQVAVVAIATANVVTATALEAGDTLSGVVLAAGNLVLLTAQSTPAQNGIYVVPGSGAASRASGFSVYDMHVGLTVILQDGPTSIVKGYICTSVAGGTIGVTALAFAPIRIGDSVYIDAREYSCVGNDGSTDQTSRFQAAIDATYAAAAAHDRNVKCIFPGGLASVSSLDFTGQATVFGVEFEAAGCLIFYADKQASSGKPVIDLTGSSFVKFSRIIVAGQTPGGSDPSILPSVGWLVAQSDAGGDSNKNSFYDCGSLGKFGNAAVYMFGSTDNAMFASAFQQDKTDAPCLYSGTSNGAGVTSPFVTIATSPGNAGDNSFFQCEFHGHRSASATAYTIDLNGVDNTRFFGGNCDNSGPAHVRFQGTNSEILFSGTKFYAESGHAADDLIYNNNGTVDQLVLQCINTSDNAFSSNLINGTGTPTFNGGSITGVAASALIGPYLYFFAQQITLGSPTVNLAGNTTKYLACGGFDTNQANAAMKVARRMRVVSMDVNTGGPPGTGKSYVFTLFKNGSSATNPTVTLSNAAQSGSDLTHAVTLDRGDTFCVEADPSTTADNTGGVCAQLGVIYC